MTEIGREPDESFESFLYRVGQATTETATFEWVEDQLFPREDTLTSDFTETATHLPVAHPEWFQVGDVIRVGADDLYDTGEIDEYGMKVFRVSNETVQVIAATMEVKRAFGANPRQSKPRNDVITLLATAPLASTTTPEASPKPGFSWETGGSANNHNRIYNLPPTSTEDT